MSFLPRAKNEKARGGGRAEWGKGKGGKGQSMSCNLLRSIAGRGGPWKSQSWQSRTMWKQNRPAHNFVIGRMHICAKKMHLLLCAVGVKVANCTTHSPSKKLILWSLSKTKEKNYLESVSDSVVSNLLHCIVVKTWLWYTSVICPSLFNLFSLLTLSCCDLTKPVEKINKP